jgi:ATP-dependent Zn protease
MIEKFGMSNKYNTYSRLDGSNGFNRDISENRQSELENEAHILLTRIYNDTMNILDNNKEKIEKIADILIKKRNILGFDFYNLMNNITDN